MTSQLTQADLMALVESSRELFSQIEREDLIQRILSKAGVLTDSLDSSIILYNEQRKSLYFAGATGDNATFLLETFGRASMEQVGLESLAGEVFESGTSQIINDVTQDSRHNKVIDNILKKYTQSMVCVPLQAGGERFGVMQLLNKRTGSYTERDKIILENFAEQAAMAIRNVRMVEDLVRYMGLYESFDDKTGTVELIKELNRPVHSEKMTIMFVDMRGFARLCQELKNPERLQQVLSDFLNMFIEEIIRHKGIVNKFLGDGLLSFFRGHNHERRAVFSAFRITEQFSGIKEEWDKQSNIPLFFLDVGIGLATDNVLIGSIGGKKRRDFTVIGNAVNLAARFEQLARGGKQILADYNTYSAVKDIVEKVLKPETLELKKSDQTHGQFYKKYHIKPKRITTKANVQVFLSHNSRDKTAVRKVAKELKSHGIRVWLDEEDLIPGRPWQEAIEEIIKTANSVAVLVGKDGIGPWEIPEMRIGISEFVKRKMPVIPVLLPGAPDQPNLLEHEAHFSGCIHHTLYPQCFHRY